MTTDEMKSRTKKYAHRTIKVSEALPKNWIAQTLGMQLLRSGSSVGANYRAVCRAKSNSDFVNKLKIVEEESDESIFWMELLIDNKLMKPDRLSNLIQEGNEIHSMIVASVKTARLNSRRTANPNVFASLTSSIVNRKS